MQHLESGVPAGPFGEAAMRFFDLGLCPIPCGGKDGKEPLITWAKWRRRPARKVFERLLGRAKNTQANIGILTGLSGITIVDCDGEGVLDEALRLFGPTPLITQTPSGGHHAWYRAQGERCANLRNKGYAIDVKGIGGFVVTPPSVRPSGVHIGKRYAFLAGGLNDLARLPSVRHEAAAWFGLRAEAKPDRTQAPIATGQRNNQLFRAALLQARSAGSEEDLLSTMRDINAMACETPLPDPELRRVVASAWAIQQQGRNWAGSGAFVCHNDRFRSLTPAALWLLAHLRLFHGAREEPFALAIDAMVAAGSIAHLSARELRKARDHLLDHGYLVRVHRGGRGAKDAAKFILGVDPAEGVRN